MTVSEFTPRLRNRIAMAIQESGLAQYEVAEKMGVRPQTVSRWVRGHQIPDVYELIQLADATGCKWLLDLNDLPTRRLDDLLSDLLERELMRAGI